MKKVFSVFMRDFKLRKGKYIKPWLKKSMLLSMSFYLLKMERKPFQYSSDSKTSSNCIKYYEFNLEFVILHEKQPNILQESKFTPEALIQEHKSSSQRFAGIFAQYIFNKRIPQNLHS